MEVVEHWIAGRRTSGTGARRGAVFNPATGERQAEVVLAGAADVDAAVDAAVEAARSWGALALGRRSRILFAFRDLVARHADELAAIITREHGKVHADALGEVHRGLDVVDFACGVPHLLKGDHSEEVSTGVDVFSLRQPLGVVAGITPFNFPVMVPMWMFPLAIAAGNAFILKPSERDPSASLRMAQLWQEAGLPDGVFTVLQGDKVAVDGLIEHPRVAAVSFVGSTPVARHVYERAGASGTRAQALGGAKNHMVVLDDADLDAAADAAVSAGYGSAGERCMAISVVAVQDGVADALVERIATRARALRVGDGARDDVDMGPLITAAHRDRVAGYLDGAVGEGATLVLDGRELALARTSDGFFLGACLLDHVTPAMAAYRDEIFGPVLSIVRIGSLDEGLELVSTNPYGNGTAVFTTSGAHARRFQREVAAGMVGVNVPIPVPMAYYSFGGWKDSLFGATHVHGEDGVRFYTRLKTVTTRWPNAEPSRVRLSFPGGDA